MVDLIIKNCRIIDGTNAPWFRGGVAVKDGRIVKVGQLGDLEAKEVVDGKDHYLTPGFIDIHSHSDTTILTYPQSESRILQGVTTEIGGNCGMSAAPCAPEHEADLKDYLREWWEEDSFPGQRIADFLKEVETKGHSVNFGTLVGHGTLRLAVMGFDAVKPTERQMGQMKALLKQALDDGVFGMSSGLIYPPGSFADTDELAELASVMRPSQALYVTHMRNEGLNLVDGVKEALEIARRAGVPLEISHHKATRKEVWYTGCKTTIAMMKEARANGQDVTFDQYPYIASSTGMDCNLPNWAFEGGVDALFARLQDPELRERICRETDESHIGRWDTIVVGDAPVKNGWAIGKSIPELAEAWGIPSAEACIRLIVEEEGKAREIHFGMCEEDVEYIMSQDFGMIGSDGEGVNLDYHGMTHPRHFGAFPRVIAHYCRDRQLFSLETAIHKMTGRTAARLGLADRGLIKEGMWADLVLFDFDTIESTPSYRNPKQPCAGIERVYVNGVLTAQDGRHTGALAGKVMRRENKG